MRAILSLVAALGAASPAVGAQPPWWMDQPVIASIGYVQAEAPANRASFSATFQAVDPTVANATRAVAEQVRAVDARLASYGAQRVQVQANFSTQPLYQEYTDSNGQRQQNMRPDKIERYAVNITFTVEVRDLRLLQQVYSEVLAAHPGATTPINFRLDPDNETRDQMFKQAVSDAMRRARLTADTTGVRLGALKLVDPSGNACESGSLFAAPPNYSGELPQSVGAPPPPPPPPPPAPMAPPAGDAPRLRVTLEPPLQQLSARACVIYALGS